MTMGRRQAKTTTGMTKQAEKWTLVDLGKTRVQILLPSSVESSRNQRGTGMKTTAVDIHTMAEKRLACRGVILER
jgi:hypothetical protein